MRLLLSNYRAITANLTKNAYYLSSTAEETSTQTDSQQSTAHSNSASSQGRINYKKKQLTRIKRSFDQQQSRDDEEQDHLDPEQQQQQVRESQWQISANHLIENDFDVMKVKPKPDLANKHLKNYEQSLALNMDIIKPKLYNEEYYKRRLAEFHLNSIAPLTKNYLNQGINFLNKQSFYKLIQSNKIGVLRELLQRGAFEKADFITPKVVDQMFEMQSYDQRNQFLLNIISYETSLVRGTVAMKDRMFYKDMRTDMQKLKSRLSNSKTLNKVRLLWSFSKLYLYENNFTAEILHELNKLTFTDGSAELLQVKRESNFISALAFSQTPFNSFISKLLKQTKTFESFMKAYSLSVILLSKLLAIHKPLDYKNSNQLHPVLQLIEYNLPKQQKDALLSKIILELLSHQDHSRIHYENYKKCYNYWLKDYTQPTRTQYHSPLSRLLQKGQNTITISYQQRQGVSQTAKSVIKIARSKKKEDDLAFKNQSQVITSLLQGKYQVVLDYFLTTFCLNTDPQLASQFYQQIKKIDKTQRFHSKDQEALCKLVAANRIFLRDSLPDTLNSQYLQQQKQHFITMCILENKPYLSQLPLNIDREFKDLRYRMILADHQDYVDKYGDEQGDKQSQSDQKVVVEQKSEDNQQEQALTTQQQSLQSIDKYLSMVLDQQEAQQASLLIKLSVEQQQPVSQPASQSAIQQVEKQSQEMDEEEEEEEEEDKLFLSEVQKAHKELGIPFDQNTVIFQSQFESQDQDEESVQFDQAYFQSPLPKNQPRPQFIKYHTDSQQQNNLQTQYRFSKKPASQEQPKFFNKKKSLFSTMKPALGTANFSTQVQLPQQGGTTKQNLFVLERIQQYRAKPVDNNFLQLMKSQVNIPQIGSGTNIAKYLFLHGKKQTEIVLNSNRSLNIEFMSSVGTRTTNYQKYLKHSLFNYELEDSFYEQMLLDQLKFYNRFELKQIIAHLIYFKQTISDPIIDAICQISQKAAIGYTFVQIAQFIKINNILISSASLRRITQTWYRFEVINEDMLSFIKEYCYKSEIPIQTQYYANYCKSLIKQEHFDKLQLVCTTILAEIRPKTFKVDSSMKPHEVQAREKEWKAKQQQNYIRLFFELIEVIVNSLTTKVPPYTDELFNDYRKLKPALDEKELGYAFVCYSHKRAQFELLLTTLQNESEKGTSFMYDCLLKALLSNFSALQDLSEKMLTATVLKNRIVLNNDQILKSLIVFKRSSSANSFSAFLQHCLRFQQDIDSNIQIKREMYYVLNNNVQEESIGGVFNLLDFIFNDKRDKERVQYRKIRLSEEEKEKKLLEIQQAKTKEEAQSTAVGVAAPTKISKKKQSQVSFDSVQEKSKVQTVKASVVSDGTKDKPKKPLRVAEKQKKRIKKQAAEQKLEKSSRAETYFEDHTDQLVLDSETKEVIEHMKNNQTRSLASSRGCLNLMDGVYGATLEQMEEEEQDRMRITEQSKKKQEGTTDDKKGSKSKAKRNRK